MTDVTQTETKESPWWLTLITGILALIVGAILLWAPVVNKAEMYLVLIAALGIYWLAKGILDIVSIFIDHSMWGWKLFMGIIGIAAGAIILMYPIGAAVALPRTFLLVFGIWGLLQGIMLLIMAFRGGGWGMGILGAVGIVFGAILIANWNEPGWGLAMIWTGAVAAVIGGIILIVQAFRQRSA